MTTVVIGIGRNLGSSTDGGTLTGPQWLKFARAVEFCASHYLSAIYFTGFGLGEFEGHVEESWTLVGEYAGSIYGASWGSFRGELDALRRTYSQDSIALTIGQTELIGGEPF